MRCTILWVWMGFALTILASCDHLRLPPDKVDAYGGNPRIGQQLVTRYGCGSCHTIPGISGARATVGPSLERFAQRTYIAGVAPNTRRDLVKWIENPLSIDEKTAMPVLGVKPQDSEDIASYLYTLD